MCMPAKPAKEPQFHPGEFVGTRRQKQWLSPSPVPRISEEFPSRRGGRLTDEAVLWSPDGSGNAFDIQARMERSGDDAPVAPPSQSRLRWGLCAGCPGCQYLRTGRKRQQAHSEACQKRIEGLLKGDRVGSSRLALVDERINRPPG